MARNAAGKQGVNSYDTELAKFASKYAKAESKAVGGNFISTKGGTFQFNGAQIGNGKEFEAIVVDYRLVNALYDGDYDPAHPASPICFAIGEDEDTMAPHEESTQKQCENCAECECNQWASGKGRGKACKNMRRLALIMEGDAESGNAPIALLSVPPTSIKNWAGYVNQLANTLHKPPFAMVTKIVNTPSGKSAINLSFEMTRQLGQKELTSIFAKLDEAKTQLIVPFAQITEQEQPKSARRIVPSGVKPKQGSKPKFGKK